MCPGYRFPLARALWLVALSLLFVVIGLAGCSKGMEAPNRAQMQQDVPRQGPGGAGEGVSQADLHSEFHKLPPSAEINLTSVSLEENTSRQAGGADEGQSAARRKIIYNSTIDIVVGDFDKAEREINSLIRTHKGYVAESESNGSPGERRGGRWKLRIPTDEYDSFVDALGRIGELQHKKQDSHDVTDEYFDLESRIKNKQVEEKSLVQLLEKTVGKMDDILVVRREISRVREEIERMQGRHQLLANQTAYTTIAIACQEHSRYVNPAAASFGDRMERTFGGSWNSLVAVGETIALFLAALAPWLPFLGLLAIAAWIAIRRQRRLAAAQAIGVESHSASG